MLLAIEQGNTNSLFAVHDGDHWIAQWRSATEPSRTADEYAVWLSQLMAMHKLELRLLNACVISSVVPQSIFNLRNLSRRYLSAEPLIVGSRGWPRLASSRRNAGGGAAANGENRDHTTGPQRRGAHSRAAGR